MSRIPATQQCVAGQPCTFEITITNGSDSAFSGRVRIGDAMEALGAGRIDNVAISKITPPFGCDSEPTTLPFDCEATLDARRRAKAGCTG